jgi:hypothetical protein
MERGGCSRHEGLAILAALTKASLIVPPCCMCAIITGDAGGEGAPHWLL